MLGQSKEDLSFGFVKVRGNLFDMLVLTDVLGVQKLLATSGYSYA